MTTEENCKCGGEKDRYSPMCAKCYTELGEWIRSQKHVRIVSDYRDDRGRR